MPYRIAFLVLTLSATATAHGSEESPAAAARAAIVRAKPAITLCVDQSRERGEKLHGRLDVELTVDREGRVEHVQTQHRGARSARFTQCVEGQLARLEMPRRAMTVSFPVTIARD